MAGCLATPNHYQELNTNGVMGHIPKTNFIESAQYIIFKMSLKSKLVKFSVFQGGIKQCLILLPMPQQPLNHSYVAVG